MAKKLNEPQSRGEFFQSLGTLIAGFVANHAEQAVVDAGHTLIRPPGALSELSFLAACTRCDKCIPVCPPRAILKAPESSGLAAGTPHLQSGGTPCFLCAALPCVQACPEGALLWPSVTLPGGDRLDGARAVRMGLAVLASSACLTFTNGTREAVACRTCVDRCPLPGEAIRMIDDATGGPPHPEILEARCTGCGVCSYVCPAPGSAIMIEPGRMD